MFSVDFKNPTEVKNITAAINDTADDLADREVKLMEVCGTHTMAIAKSGIRSMIPKNIRLISGPGCPVCVTPAGTIDAVLELSEDKSVMITTYGDMVRVPGSTPGDSLMHRRAEGANVTIVYSPVDAVEIAKSHPEKQVVFLGVGFETTAPGTAAAIMTAADEGIKNFTVLSMLKTVEPALRALASSPDFDIDGFLCPGHVATIIGEEGFRFIPHDLCLPAVIAGFEPLDILTCVFLLLRQLRNKCPKIENEYTRAVTMDGNFLAQSIMRKCFIPCDDSWRGLGLIPESGLAINEKYSFFDAAKRFGIVSGGDGKDTYCRCGDVIRGKLEPWGCPLFGKACTPEDPVGPCMVSGEGACSAAYKYRSEVQYG